MPDRTADAIITTLKASLSDRYRVDREIGRGGMATVYLAYDLRHDRQVALKVLNPELGAVLGVERFFAEIKVTAHLHHPNLLPLFDSGEADGLLYYVMPFVEGESLRQRMDRERQLPIDDAVHIALAVAGALDYAHEHSVVHRDLKPENILLQHGEPMIADFGIALAVSNAGGNRITQTGLSLGTPQYMSPEQATADRTIDGRTDIYSLGAVLYEMLVGEPPHSGATAQAVIAKLMTEEPRPVTLLRRSVPEPVADAVHRALEKVPADRWRTAHEFADALRAAESGDGPPRRRAASGASARWSRVQTGIAAAAAAAVVTAAGAGIVLARRAADARSARTERTVRFTLVTSDSQRFIPTTRGIPIAISPDDRLIAYVGNSPAGTRLFVRNLEDMTTHALTGYQGPPEQPVFSPDGQWIAFQADDGLVKAPAAGGPLTTIMPLNGASDAGLAWVEPDTIVASLNGALVAVPADGGPTVTLSRPDTTRGERLQWGPRAASRRFIAYIVVGPAGVGGNRLGFLDRRTGKTTITDISATVILGVIDDELLWITPSGAGMAARFDDRGQLSTPHRVLDDVLVRPGGAAKAALSARGSLIYQRGQSQSRLVIVDEHGAVQPLPIAPGSFWHPRWSPDGSHIAVTVRTSNGSEIWLIDSRNFTTRQLTPPGEVADEAEWMPDGAGVIYRQASPSSSAIRFVPIGGSPPVTVVESAVNPYSARATPDGRQVVFTEYDRATRLFQLAMAPFDHSHPPQLLPDQPPVQMYTPSASPDGRLLAYMSGQRDTRVYVRPLAGPGAPVQVSAGDGSEPLWGADSHTLFYRTLGRTVMAAHLGDGPTPNVDHVTQLFTVDALGDAAYGNFDVSRDGRRFLMLQNVDQESETVVVYNWAGELRRNAR